MRRDRSELSSSTISTERLVASVEAPVAASTATVKEKATSTRMIGSADAAHLLDCQPEDVGQGNHSLANRLLLVRLAFVTTHLFEECKLC